jgi:O-antigen ligase
LTKGSYLIITAISGIFLLDLLLILAFSGSEFNQQFFGANGRNTGFLAYASLIFLFLAMVLYTSKDFLKKMSYALLSTGVISLAYGYLQHFGNDPIKWNNPYNSIIAFLGNPDFSSAFLGISAVVGVAMFFGNNTKLQFKIIIVLYELLNFYLIKSTHAQQGVIVLGICSATTLYIYLLKKPGVKPYLKRLYLGILVITSVVVSLGIFKIGPLANSLYKISVRQRGFYWHAALKMMGQNPVFGVGLDSYGDHYFQTRSANAAFHTLQTQSNAAHNVFLDFGATGGLPLFVLNIAIVLYTLYCGIKVLRSESEFNTFFVAIFSAWIGYQAQSVVSINNLGLAVWGWALGGIVIGYSFSMEKIKETENSKPRARLGRRSKAKFNFSAPLIGLAVGLLIVTPNFMADHSYRVAIASQNVSNIMQASAKYPEDLNRTLNAAQLLSGNNLNSQALTLAEHVVKKNNLNYNAWNVIARITPTSDPRHQKAISRMQVLNPQDKTIK